MYSPAGAAGMRDDELTRISEDGTWGRSEKIAGVRRMKDWFRRLFEITRAEAHSRLDVLEDPAKLTDQALRDLRQELACSLQNLAEVRAGAIHLKRELEERQETVRVCEQQALVILQRVQIGKMPASEGDRLAWEALARKHQSLVQCHRIARTLEKQESLISQLLANIQKLKAHLNTWEHEAMVLKTRAKAAKTSKRIHRKLAILNEPESLGLLHRMKTQVGENEAMAEAYQEMAMAGEGVECAIQQSLIQEQTIRELECLKQQVGLPSSTPPSDKYLT